MHYLVNLIKFDNQSSWVWYVLLLQSKSFWSEIFLCTQLYKHLRLDIRKKIFFFHSFILILSFSSSRWILLLWSIHPRRTNPHFINKAQLVRTYAPSRVTFHWKGLKRVHILPLICTLKIQETYKMYTVAKGSVRLDVIQIYFHLMIKKNNFANGIMRCNSTLVLA